MLGSKMMNECYNPWVFTTHIGNGYWWNTFWCLGYQPLNQECSLYVGYNHNRQTIRKGKESHLRITKSLPLKLFDCAREILRWLDISSGREHIATGASDGFLFRWELLLLCYNDVLHFYGQRPSCWVFFHSESYP